jgi:hypothetical protein
MGLLLIVRFSVLVQVSVEDLYNEADERLFPVRNRGIINFTNRYARRNHQGVAFQDAEQLARISAPPTAAFRILFLKKRSKDLWVRFIVSMKKKSGLKAKSNNKRDNSRPLRMFRRGS